MINRRQLFLDRIAQTSEMPAIVDVSHAEGIFIYDRNGDRYTDLSSGIGPNILGHRHPVILEAIEKQTSGYLHTMVYGEHIQSPQLDLAQLLLDTLPEKMEQVYFLSSGSEAVEAALKVARIYTNRREVVSAGRAYHGSTIGAESLRSDHSFLQNIGPLVPGTRHIRFNQSEDLEKITDRTAAVICETVQAENGVIVPSADYFQALRKRCDSTGTLLIFDEIQIGLCRSGQFHAFEHFGICPDILVLGKALGGSLPLSAVISSKEVLQSISRQVPLAHLTTFGGHPLCCATGFAALNFLKENQMWSRAKEIGQKFVDLLQNGPWKMWSIGAMIAFDVGSEKKAVEWFEALHGAKIVTDLLLFDLHCWRIAPPLTITDKEIEEVCDKILTLGQMIEN